ncbi:hypothetical protein [Streptomyces sp. NBC_01538]|uniref:hypothetical protein n=1 Tax=Streptomyces sp. NBC_01538 TaxID=2903897 RepID=UPI0038658BAE
MPAYTSSAKVAVFRHLGCPGARQAVQIVRRRRRLSTGRLTIERVCLITGHDVSDATPAELSAWIRGHRGICRDHLRPLSILGLT